jgi:hypothetical protein
MCRIRTVVGRCDLGIFSRGALIPLWRCTYAWRDQDTFARSFSAFLVRGDHLFHGWTFDSDVWVADAPHASVHAERKT